MRTLGQTTADLARYRRRWQDVMASAPTFAEANDPHPAQSRLREVTGFGSNPGNLRMFAHVPERHLESPALVVVLHGCKQTATGYDQGAGWSMLADRYGFTVLVPEQQAANNPNACFNWFQPGDIERDRGEAKSIREMVERMVVDHGVDRSRIFVTGLSAGGAMTSVMLATYPDVFAGGAIIAGLPYGCATTVQDALACMFQGRSRPAREWGDLVRTASPHEGRWPRVSVWHGSRDATVLPMNADEVVKQWTDVHGLDAAPTLTDTVNGYPRSVWRGPDGQDLVEAFTITSMAHGTPIGAGQDDDVWGTAGAYILEAGISSSYHIAKFWGLTDKAAASDRTAETEALAPKAAKVAAAPAESVALVSPQGVIEFAPKRAPASTPNHKERASQQPASQERTPRERGSANGSRGDARAGRSRSIDVQAVIAKALKAAGLMKS